MTHKNPVISETIRLAIGEFICLALMLGIYALIGRFSISVFTGGLVGTVLTIGNFFFMAVGLYNMTADSAGAGKRLLAQGSYLLRTLALLVLLVIAIKYGGCDVLATVIPLLAMRPVIMVEQFIVNARLERVKENEQTAETVKKEEA